MTLTLAAVAFLCSLVGGMIGALVPRIRWLDRYVFDPTLGRLLAWWEARR